MRSDQIVAKWNPVCHQFAPTLAGVPAEPELKAPDVKSAMVAHRNRVAALTVRLLFVLDQTKMSPALLERKTLYPQNRNKAPVMCKKGNDSTGGSSNAVPGRGGEVER